MVTIANFREDQYPATAETQCVKIYIPAGDEYKQLLAGLLALPARPANFQDPESAQTEGVSAIWRDAYDLTDWEHCGTPPECIKMNTNLILFPVSAQISSGGNFAWSTDGAFELGGYWSQSPAATADQFRWRQYLAPGQWDYTVTYLRNVGNGKGDFYITADFSSFLENVVFDLRGALLRNAKFSGNFTVPEPGGQFYIGLDGTGTSSGTTFNRPINRLEMWKTADL